MAYEAVLKAIELGYRHIDTAAMYGNEASVGRAIRDSGVPRKEIFLTTKLANESHDDVLGGFQASLERLGLDYVDLFLIHWPMPQRLASWKTLEELYGQTDAPVKAIGVSNFTIRHLEELLAAANIMPVVNQVEFSPFLFQQELLAFAGNHDIALVAYSPLTRAHKLSDDTIGQIAGTYGKSPAQIMLRWAIQHGLCVIPRSGNPEHIAENIDVFDWEITAQDMKTLDGLNRDMRVMDDPNHYA